MSRSLAAMRREGFGALYLATDTHWRPETMEWIAAELAGFIEREAALSEPTGGYRQRRVEITNEGDTARLLDLGTHQTRSPRETVTVTRIETVRGEAWAPDRSAEILLVGDSFTNLYSLASLGWGVSAGFAEQLSFALGGPDQPERQRCPGSPPSPGGGGDARRWSPREHTRGGVPVRRARALAGRLAADRDGDRNRARGRAATASGLRTSIRSPPWKPRWPRRARYPGRDPCRIGITSWRSTSRRSTCLPDRLQTPLRQRSSTCVV